ncbi:M14 family metallopeptidase, partial [Pseudomonas citronellolis]|uniref:M14 family metallopeptidase n=1 Tax=Pseudomonas citronellolis TaxID=53408 RepID=UPI0023E3F218
MNPSACFSQSYAEARGKFLEACAAAGLSVESHAHPLPGRDGEALALDVARAGPMDARHLLLVSSGCHGVEGFCGSAVQIALLRDPNWLAEALAGGCAVLFLHAANPYGFSWWRRWTHENVDLNRNFLDFSAPAPQNPGYESLDPILIPRHWPARLSRARLLLHALRHGKRSLQAAISAGQASHPSGLFYVGAEPTWSNRTVRQVLRQHGSQCRELAWIDLHTGLGPRGYGEYIYSGDPSAESLARARAWWGDVVRSTDEGNSVSVKLSGKMVHASFEECPQARLTSVTLEFGTLAGLKVLDALRAEQWLERTPQAPAEQAGKIKRQLRDAFYVDEDDWKRQVLEQSRVAADG